MTVLQKIQKNTVSINTARADLIDENAVLEALNQGVLGAYATDVFKVEPPEPHPLWQHDKVITTPHIGGFTKESVARATEMAVDNLLKVLNQSE